MLSVLTGPFPFVSSGLSSSQFLEGAHGFSQVLIHCSIAKCMSFHVLMCSCCVPFMVFPHYRWKRESVNSQGSNQGFQKMCFQIPVLFFKMWHPKNLSLNSSFVTPIWQYYLSGNILLLQSSIATAATAITWNSCSGIYQYSRQHTVPCTMTIVPQTLYIPQFNSSCKIGKGLY